MNKVIKNIEIIGMNSEPTVFPYVTFMVCCRIVRPELLLFFVYS